MLSTLVIAAQLSAQRSIADTAFYGMFREGAPLELPALFALTPAEWRTALTAAFDDNVIPAAQRSQIDTIVGS